MSSDDIKALDAQYVMQTYGRFDVVIDKGKGSTLYSPEGKEYIDFTSGIGVNSIGYGNMKWAEAIYNQAVNLQHISNLFYSLPYAELAEILIKRSGMDKVFFSNAGGEANEGMIKLARKYSFDKYGPGRSTIVSLKQSFHGRTITTLAATGQESFHNYFFPFTEGFKHVPANDVAALKVLLSKANAAPAQVDGSLALAPEQPAEGVCGVLIELIQGEGGVLPLDPDYVLAVAEICREMDLLLLIDEVQTGVGRTGTLFAYQQYGISPDVVSFAKGIAGGLPMGGILANKKCSAVLTAGTHATTFGGNPIAAAGAVQVLTQLDDDALSGVVKKGEYITGAIRGWHLPCITEVRGKGLMIGVSLAGIAPKDAAAECVGDGLLILTAGADALRLLPPLTISFEEIDKGLDILKGVLIRVSANEGLE
ncbi:MAG: acetylornithine/succinylornithine family transaminase [Oscillospiraceae bacterium]|nr:acetylornithine/succinylornithine family transaminase [Oscillospiraceae bacterium]